MDRLVALLERLRAAGLEMSSIVLAHSPMMA